VIYSVFQSTKHIQSVIRKLTIRPTDSKDKIAKICRELDEATISFNPSEPNTPNEGPYKKAENPEMQTQSHESIPTDPQPIGPPSLKFREF
jgi:hypothetical protein